MENSPVRVLIIEDDPAISRALERSLAKAGLHCHVARDGVQAMTALQTLELDFVLCDYQLPDTNGEKLCRFIRTESRCPEIPIALCTAKAHEVDIAALIVEFGLTNVFFKPFSIREIAAEICKALQSHSGSVTL